MKLCLQCAHIFTLQDWKCPVCGFAPQVSEKMLSFISSGNGNGYRPELFAELVQLEACQFWFSWRNRLIILVLKKYFPMMENFLEIGCGTGFVLTAVASAFPSTQISGSEYFSEGLAIAEKRLLQARFYQMDGRRLPFVEEFDVIGAFDVLEHIDADELVLTQAFRALRLGGGIVLSVPQHRWLWSPADESASHVRRYEMQELIRKVEKAGFRVEYVTSFVSLLLPALAISRLCRVNNRVSDHHLGELRLHPLLNAAFSMVMGLEFGLITLGFRLPAGGSLLVVGRKERILTDDTLQ